MNYLKLNILYLTEPDLELSLGYILLTMSYPPYLKLCCFLFLTYESYTGYNVSKTNETQHIYFFFQHFGYIPLSSDPIGF